MFLTLAAKPIAQVFLLGVTAGFSWAAKYTFEE